MEKEKVGHIRLPCRRADPYVVVATLFKFHLYIRYAPVVELADTLDLGNDTSV